MDGCLDGLYDNSTVTARVQLRLVGWLVTVVGAGGGMEWLVSWWLVGLSYDGGAKLYEYDRLGGKEAPDTCGNYDDTFVGFWVDGCMI